jgi:hypothetical protein
MDLTDKNIEHFREAWSDAFGETLSPDDARSEAVRLRNFYRFLIALEPPPERTNTASPTSTHELPSLLPQVERRRRPTSTVD